MKNLNQLVLFLFFSLTIPMNYVKFFSSASAASVDKEFTLNENLFPIDCINFQSELTKSNPSDDFIIQGEPEVLSLIEFTSLSFPAKLKSKSLFLPDEKKDNNFNLNVLNILKINRTNTQGSASTTYENTDIGNYLSNSYFDHFNKSMNRKITYLNFSSHSGRGGMYSIQAAAAEPSNDVSVDLLNKVFGIKTNPLNLSLKNWSLQDLLNNSRPRSKDRQKGKNNRRKYTKLICDSFTSRNQEDGNQVYFKNQCRHPVEIALSYKIPSKINSKELSIWKVEGWWNFEGGESGHLNVNNRRIISDNSNFYLYGSITNPKHNSYGWTGSIEMEMGEKRLPMRLIESSYDSEGNHVLSIACNNL